MLKLLITGIIVYFLYKRFFGLPESTKEKDSFLKNKPDQPDRQSDNDDSEYIDYEEID